MSYPNYPLIKLRNRNFLLSIYPSWHTRLFPESKLNNEDGSLIQDVSHTNSIEKVYLTKMDGTQHLQFGDNLLIYRTSDGQGPARYRSVATSVCVVLSVRNIHEFSTYKDFRDYCAPFSVFDEDELKLLYAKKNYPYIIRFTYNFPLTKRIIRDDIMTITGYTDANYWGFLPLSDADFKKIITDGGVNEGYIVN
ncbi:hypothetical protein [Klebsiella variicola]|uniref:hypothetical protein n=1 Tax=Klebsiella variicola TaxID=244366 RepID=UPI000E2B6F3E|nr:hypothetical protein [Klebsiella variicola]SXF33095.1 Uncharacterised protein [Klebsiella variicola]HCK0931599.1 hypothetical protein [Klebsiella oxytoca]